MVWVHDFDGCEEDEEWSTGQAVGGSEDVGGLDASEARAWASQASRVLWSTGQASLSAILCVMSLPMCDG
jgi:hypothetical protein